MKTVKQVLCLIALTAVLVSTTVAQDQTSNPNCTPIYDRDGVIIPMYNCPSSAQSAEGVIIPMRTQDGGYMDTTAETLLLFNQIIAALL